jgi:hypothetical protein
MMIVAAGSAAAAPTESVLYSFQGGSDANGPAGYLISDRAGALYSTDATGAVFKLTPPAAPAMPWAITELGFGAGLFPIIDNMGALFGQQNSGWYCLDPPPCLVASPWEYDLSFDQFTPPASGTGAWTGTGLWGDSVVCPLELGCPFLVGVPYVSSVTRDAAGTVYIAEGNGHGVSVGFVYQLTPPPSRTGSWTATDLYTFSDGSSASNLTLDNSGTLYGTTADGGTFGHGTLFTLTPPPGGGTPWIRTVLYNFAGGSDGSVTGSMVFDASGALYAPAGGGAHGQGG